MVLERMLENYLQILLFFISIIIVLFTAYGVQVSEVKYYRRGLTLMGFGFALVSIALLTSLLNINSHTTPLYLNIGGYLLVLSGIVLLTWFRRNLGL